MPGSVAHALATTLSERVMAMGRACSSGVEASHEDLASASEEQSRNRTAPSG
jgi:hypothetical protein